jgi:SUKH superfamily protein
MRGASSIVRLEQQLGFSLSSEYRAYLLTFGVIIHGGNEVYGLGVPDNYYLNDFNAYGDLSRDPEYPANAVPLIYIGDGQYWLYANRAQRIVLWATPNGGIVKPIDDSLERFLIERLFERQ